MSPFARRILGLVLLSCGLWGAFAGRTIFPPHKGDRIEQNLAELRRRIDELRYQSGEIDAPPPADEGSPHQLPLPIAVCMALCGLVMVVAPERDGKGPRPDVIVMP